MNKTRLLAAAALLLAGSALSTAPAQAQGNGANSNRRSEVGAWFGSAVPAQCNLPQCPPRIVMMPQFNADGTMVATDTGSFLDNHLIGQGNWTDARGNDGIKATFMWLQPAAANLPGAGVFRVRLLGRLERGDNNTMLGTIEPFFTPFGPDGLPVADALVSPLPDCTLPNGCLGIFSFEVKRIPTE